MVLASFFIVMRLHPPRSTLFPYTTLFRSVLQLAGFGLLALNPFVLDFFSLARGYGPALAFEMRSEEHTSELQSQSNLVCRLLLENKKLSVSERSCSASGNIVFDFFSARDL